VNVLVEELRFLHEPLKLCHTVKQTTGNFSSHFAMHVMNREVNRISDELQPLGAILHLLKLLNVDIRETDLLYGRGRRCVLGGWLSSHDWGTRIGVEVLARHAHVVLVHVRGATGSLGLALRATTTGVASTVATAAIVLSSTTLLVVVVVISSLFVLIESLLLVLLSVRGSTKASHTAHVAHLLLHSFGLISEILRMSDPVHHLVLFFMVTFIFEFLLGDPEVNRYRSVSERRHLVQIFDRKLSMVNILI